MTFIIEKNVYIKKWKTGSPCCIIIDRKRPYFLDPDEYELLKRCDGNTELSPSDLTYRLEAFGIIRRCAKGEAHLKEDQITEYSNCYVKTIDWTITDRCNYNCLHCFHAADNSMQRNEFTLSESMKFLDDVADCGIRFLRLTGGEPTLYPYFRDVIKGMRERGISLMHLITNGSLLTPELLGFIKEYHPNARMMISFDGIGWHDWLRQHKGSEEKTLEAIRLCKDAAFPVNINSNLHRKNKDVMFDTVAMLADIGVDTLRIIRTTEAPRWELNKENNSLSPEEYYDFSCSFAKQYRQSSITLPVTIWQSLYLNGQKKTFHCLTMKSTDGCVSENASICNGMLNKPSVQANGEFVPCAPVAGYSELHDMHFGNVLKTPLKELLTEGPFIDTIRATVKEKFQHNQKCASCTYAGYCQGGCPALSLICGGSFFSSDLYKCIFFEKGYYEKYCAVMEGWSMS